MELVKPVIDYFQNKGYKVRREIKINFFYADIVAFKNNTVTAVELKLRDWKKAIIQAKNYQFGADYIFIAIPMKKSFNILRKTQLKLEKEGIGLLLVNEKTCKVSKLIKAKKSNKLIETVSISDIDNKVINKKFKNIFLNIL